MNRYDKKALLELFKSMARYIWFGLLGLVVTVLTVLATSGAVNDTYITVGGLTLNLGVLIAAGAASIAKAIDQYVHKNENYDSKGIAPSFLQR